MVSTSTFFLQGSSRTYAASLLISNDCLGPCASLCRFETLFRALFRMPVPCCYVPERPSNKLGHGYLVVDYVEGRQLSEK